MRILVNTTAAATLVALALAGTATAQTGSSASGDAEVIKVYDAGTLKPADIRACLRQDQRLGDLEKRLADYQASMATHRERITALEKELDRRRKQIDGTDPEAVKVYNARVERHRTMIDTYNDEMLPTLERRREQLNQLVRDYNRDCADKSYFEDDWQAALTELGVSDPRPSGSGGK
jgi:Skp family chaperone for outer membrane proteins